MPTISSPGLNINVLFGAFIIVFGSSFLFGFNLGVLNQLQNHIKDFYNSTYYSRSGQVSDSTLTVTWSMTTALFIPGGLIGAVIGGRLADSLGRKRTILLSHLFVFIGGIMSCICVIARSPELLMLSRVFLGVNSGIASCLAPMFLSEIAPLKYRGSFGTFHQLFITLGILISSALGIEQILGHYLYRFSLRWSRTRSMWPYLIMLQVLPASASLVILPFLPETPRYLLLLKGNRVEASNALKFYRRSEDVDKELEEMDEENQSAGDKKSGGADQAFTLRKLFTTVDLRRPLLIACLLQVIQQLSGINAVIFYSKSIFTNSKVPEEYIPYAIIGTNAVIVLATIVAVFLMDIAGRRPLLILPMVTMIITLILMTICRVLHEIYRITGLAYASVACVILYVIAFSVGLGPIPWLMSPELFRQGPRPLALALATVVNWVSNFVVAMTFESIQEVAGNYTFLIFVFTLMASVALVYFFVPETKNKTVEEISEELSRGKANRGKIDNENIPMSAARRADEVQQRRECPMITLTPEPGQKAVTLLESKIV